MDPKALGRLRQLAHRPRTEAISAGLIALAEHSSTLRRDAALLHEAGGRRGVMPLIHQADEEAAKALILLDVFRDGGSPWERLDDQIDNFYKHLARCIYAEMVHFSPASFAEALAAVERLRRSHHLDGPNDIDWIYRNELLATREEGLYVDYVAEEEGNRWTTPAEEEFRVEGFLPTSGATRLLEALSRSGALTVPGLSQLEEIWQDIEVEPATRWVVVDALNREVLEGLQDAGLSSPDFESADANYCVACWGFPLGRCELAEIKVKKSELRKERELGLKRIYGEWM
jgi:AbiV family abortive infection protein